MHTALWEKLVSTEGPGEPCTLQLERKVASVDPDESEVVLANGERVSGDLILGADGVHVSIIFPPIYIKNRKKTGIRESPNAARPSREDQAMSPLIVEIALFGSLSRPRLSKTILSQDQ